MEKKAKKIKKNQNKSIEDSVLMFLDRSMRKSLKRGYYGTGMSLSFMRDEYVDRIGQMEPAAVINLLNSAGLKDSLIDKIGQVLFNLVVQERTRRVNLVRQRIARAERTRKWRLAAKKRKEKWAQDNAKKIQAHKNLQKAIDEKLPKRYANMLKKLAPGLKNEPKYNPYSYNY